MKIRMFFTFALCLSLSALYSQGSPEGKITEKIGLYSDSAQIDSLSKIYESFLIINDSIYQVPCSCYPCRNLGGDSEDRTLGGDNEDRTLGGDSEDRTLGGDSEDRTLGGDSEDRTLGGDSEDRTLGGDSEDRTLGGDSEDRTLGGDSEDRTLGGDSEDRTLGGDFQEISCKGSTRSFEIFGLNPSSVIYFFDGLELKLVQGSIVKW